MMSSSSEWKKTLQLVRNGLNAAISALPPTSSLRPTSERLVSRIEEAWGAGRLDRDALQQLTELAHLTPAATQVLFRATVDNVLNWHTELLERTEKAD